MVDVDELGCWFWMNVDFVDQHWPTISHLSLHIFTLKTCYSNPPFFLPTNNESNEARPRSSAMRSPKSLNDGWIWSLNGGYSIMKLTSCHNGDGSKPCRPGEHQNRWQMDVHPTKNGMYRYWSIAIWSIKITIDHYRSLVEWIMIQPMVDWNDINGIWMYLMVSIRIICEIVRWLCW